MSARANRRPQTEALPGMPDIAVGPKSSQDKKPPKASDGSWKARTLDEAITRTHELVDQAIEQFSTGDAIIKFKIKKGPRKGQTGTRNLGRREIAGIYLLFSGGNDSVIPLHLLRDRVDGIIHVNTGTAIRQTTEHVRDVAKAWGLPLHELSPRPGTYLDLALGNVLSTRGPNIGRPVWIGFPGPGGDSHKVMYRRLKDEPLQAFRAERVGGEGGRKKVLYLAGMRWDESDPRFRNACEIDPDGGIVWVSPVVHWTDAHMQEYRERHRCHVDHEHAPHRMCVPDALPLNEVTEHLHMSGDCTCGAFAKDGELDQIEFFYPEKAAEIRDMEQIVQAAGIPACRWGQRTPESAQRRKRVNPAGDDYRATRLCNGCTPQLDGQLDLLDQWLEAGLVTAEQYERLTGGTCAA